MDVFLVPVRPPGEGRTSPFVLYCEPAPEPIEPEVVGDGVARPGLLTRMKRSFRQALAEGEAERRRREAGEPESVAGTRLGRFVKRKLADSVAEHRLLWALRHVSSARLVHPDTMEPRRAVDIAVGECRRDLNKHGFWCAFDGLLFVASGLIAIVPGPNLLAYYLLFRCVSHYLSLVGAMRGAKATTWQPEASPALSSVADALRLPDAERDGRVAAAATQLGLERLVVFVSRMLLRRP